MGVTRKTSAYVVVLVSLLLPIGGSVIAGPASAGTKWTLVDKGSASGANSLANANGEAWTWKKVKRKTDRNDALKLAKMFLMNQLPTVHMPQTSVRQWKGLIKYRHALVDRRTGIKNTIRSLLDSQGLPMSGRSKAWTIAAVKDLSAMSKPLEAKGMARSSLSVYVTAREPAASRRWWH